MKRPGPPAGRIAYVDGRYVPHARAMVHVEDRGLQFADAVYEVCSVLNGKLLEVPGHLDRLERSLRELAMPMPMARNALSAVMHETLRRNRLKDGLLYMQVTRGAYRRDHPIPIAAHSTLIVTARRLDMTMMEKRRSAGIAVITRPENRWGRCDIKTTGLLANVLAKTQARQAGAYEVWFVDREGLIAEGSSTNAWIVTKGTIVTRDLSANILAGVTRAGVLDAARGAQIRAEERGFTLQDAYGADEAFITSATGGVIPVVQIDGHTIGDGRPGALTRRIHALYQAQSEAAAQ